MAQYLQLKLSGIADPSVSPLPTAFANAGPLASAQHPVSAVGKAASQKSQSPTLCLAMGLPPLHLALPFRFAN